MSYYQLELTIKYSLAPIIFFYNLDIHNDSLFGEMHRTNFKGERSAS